MSRIDELFEQYELMVSRPWPRDLAAPQRVWFAVYSPEQERRLRLRLPDFAEVTIKHGHGWNEIDLTGDFARWLAVHEYRDALFERPERASYALSEYLDELAERLRATLDVPDTGAGQVVALTGVGALFGIARVSALIDRIEDAVQGRLLVFFPGHHDEQNNFRFLDARDGWNYLAVVIKA